MEVGNSIILPQPATYGLLLSDLRGFTAVTSEYPILQLVPLLDHFFRQMSMIIDRHGGVIDKFMGDSILALFPIDSPRDAALTMLSCAIDMQQAMDEVNAFGSSLRLPPLYMGIGLTIGTIVSCTLGSDVYREKTVLGEPVNLVSRMASFALRGQVLISEAILNPARDFIDTGSSYKVSIKGLRDLVSVYDIQALHYPNYKAIPQRENRRSPRVEVVLPISYHLIEGKRVLAQSVKADILDLSYGGMRILTPQEHRSLDEIKIDLSMGLDGELYAKVLACTPQQQRGSFCISTEFSYVDEAVTKSIRNLVDHLA